MLEKPIPPVKDAEPDDPEELTGVALPGDTEEEMAQCFVEEYAMQGFTDDMILKLFREPFFAGTHAIYRHRGEKWVVDLIARVRSKWGTFRYRTGILRCPEVTLG